jgi:hypothetical protein
MVVKSSNALRVNSRCTGRHMEDLRNGHNTSISSAQAVTHGGKHQGRRPLLPPVGGTDQAPPRD